MRRTPIDFIASGARSSRLGTLLFVLGALLSGAAVMDDMSRREALAQSQERLERAQAAYKRAEAARAPKRGNELAELKQSGDIARRLLSPWGDLLDALERADNAAVALLTIEPDAERGRLRLSGEAKNLDALVAYIKSLDDKAGIADLRLMTQQVKQNDAQKPVEFVLEANWLRKSQSKSVSGANT